MASLNERIGIAADNLCDETVGLLRELVRIPSVNHPPGGDEKPVQEFYARVLRNLGLETKVCEPDSLDAFLSHPGRAVTHEMKDRPFVAGVLRGTGGGRSMMLLAHADVETTGDSSLWKCGDPFSGLLKDGRVYGRGASDDKSGMAIGAMVVRVLREAGISLKGDLIVASVPDEEQAGGNGTVALLCDGYRADGAIYLDGPNLDLSLANLGGGYCDVDFEVPGPQKDLTALLACLDLIRERIAVYRDKRLELFSRHPYYGEDLSYLPVRITRVQAGNTEFHRGSFRTWFYQLPGEESEVLQSEFETALSEMTDGGTWKTRWMPRFLPGSQIPEDHPLAQSIATAFRGMTGREPVVSGALMNDTGIVNRWGGFPCISFGVNRTGVEGAIHEPDEFVEVSALMECLKITACCTAMWCGCSE